MRHPRRAAEHMTDAVARPLGHPGLRPHHRHPRAKLAIEPRREVTGIRLARAQPAIQQPQRLQRGAIAHRLSIGRAQILHRMIDRADAGRQPKPLRRRHGHGGVQDHALGDHRRGGIALLARRPAIRRQGVGAAGKRGELARRQGRRDRHGANARQRLGPPRHPVRPGDGAQPVEVARFGNIVGQAHADHLGGVGHRAAAERHQQVGPRLPCRIAGRHHIDARRMCANSRPGTRQIIAQRRLRRRHERRFPG